MQRLPHNIKAHNAKAGEEEEEEEEEGRGALEAPTVNNNAMATHLSAAREDDAALRNSRHLISVISGKRREADSRWSITLQLLAFLIWYILCSSQTGLLTLHLISNGLKCIYLLRSEIIVFRHSLGRLPWNRNAILVVRMSGSGLVVCVDAFCGSDTLNVVRERHELLWMSVCVCVYWGGPCSRLRTTGVERYTERYLRQQEMENEQWTPGTFTTCRDVTIRANWGNVEECQ